MSNNIFRRIICINQFGSRSGLSRQFSVGPDLGSKGYKSADDKSCRHYLHGICKAYTLKNNFRMINDDRFQQMTEVSGLINIAVHAENVGNARLVFFSYVRSILNGDLGTIVL